MDILVEFIHKIYNSFGGITIIIILLVFVYVMYKAHHLRQLDWADLVTNNDSIHVSLTKFLQLIGGITGTWMVVYSTLHDKLTYDLLLVYLAYVGAIEGWSKFVSARYGVDFSKTHPIPKKKKIITKKESEETDE